MAAPDTNDPAHQKALGKLDRGTAEISKRTAAEWLPEITPTKLMAW